MVLTPANGQERGQKSLPTAGKSDDFTPAPPQGDFEHEGLVVMGPESKKGMPSLNMPSCRLVRRLQRGSLAAAPCCHSDDSVKTFLLSASVAPQDGILITISWQQDVHTLSQEPGLNA